MKLEDLGEDRMLARILPRLPRGKLVVAGAGDDCAIVRPPSGGKLVVLKTDCVVESIHFQPETNPGDVGWKAMMRPLSDFAATSAVPRFALVTLIVSKKTNSNWVEKVHRGLHRAAARCNPRWTFSTQLLFVFFETIRVTRANRGTADVAAKSLSGRIMAFQPTSTGFVSG